MYSIVGDEEIQHLVSWSKEGDIFSVKNPTEFARTILPQYFKHNNWQSFVRQLNSKLDVLITSMVLRYSPTSLINCCYWKISL